MSAALRLALAVVLVWLMPWRATRKLRTQERAMAWLVERTLAVYRQNGELQARMGMPAPRPARHLHIVK